MTFFIVVYTSFYEIVVCTSYVKYRVVKERKEKQAAIRCQLWALTTMRFWRRRLNRHFVNDRWGSGPSVRDEVETRSSPEHLRFSPLMISVSSPRSSLPFPAAGRRRGHSLRPRRTFCLRRARTRYVRSPLLFPSLPAACAKRSTANPNDSYLY